MICHYIDDFADDLGPEKIIHIYEPKSKLKAIVVIDNLSLGPAIGGCRMAADVGAREVFRLARAMTLKNAINGLPHGGAKSAILSEPSIVNKETLVRAFAQSIKKLTDYIPGPDMGTDENCMAYIHDEIGRSIGLPKVLGGIPLDELGMTGFGLAVAADVACEFIPLNLEGARVVIQGFGNVGKAAAKYLLERGVKIIGVSNSRGAIYNPTGLDIPVLVGRVGPDGDLAASGLGEPISKEDLLEVESDIFIPAARPDVFTEENQHLLKTRLALEGANIPITHAAAKEIHKRGILVVPDIIANGGGVICAATEYLSQTETSAFEKIKSTIGGNTRELLERTRETNFPPHEIALRMARERIAQAMAYRAHM
ncbi:MAG: Glu/Leu/Phe/Val dehydrogenase [Nitrospinales bacterium]